MRNAYHYVYLGTPEDKFRLLFKGDYRIVMDFFGVNRATAYRWLAAGAPTHPTALKLLDIAASGFLPCIEGWNGYFIYNGRLVTPRGYDVAPGEIETMCEQLGRYPMASSVMDQPRMAKPWRDREPKFVKRFKRK